MAYAVIIGLGGTGGKVLQRIHEHLSEMPSDQRERFRLLVIDTDRSALDDLRLPEEAKLHAGGDVRQLRPSNRRRYHPWLSRFPLDQLPAIVLDRGAGQFRPLGALAFAWNFPTIRAKVHDILWHLRRHDQAVGGAAPRIVAAVVTSLAGGTGSGMFIEMGYLLRHVLREMGADNDAEILLFAVGPQAFHDVQGPRLLSNSMAALRELELWTNRGNFKQEYRGDGVVEVDAPPFHWVLYLDAVDEGGWVWSGVEDLADTVANALLILAADPVGGHGRSVIENIREDLRGQLADQTPSGELTFLSSVGVASLRFPVSQIVEALAARRGKALLESMLRPAAEAGQAEAERWTMARPWGAQALASAFQRRPDGSSLGFFLNPPEWLKDEDPERMPHEALRFIDQIRQLSEDEAARVVWEASNAWLIEARNDLEGSLAGLVRDSLLEALSFVKDLRGKAGELQRTLQTRRQEAERQEEGLQGRLTAPALPWWWRLIGWIPLLGRRLRRRWAWRVVARLYSIGEQYLKARLERMTLEAAGQAVAALMGTLEERCQELEALAIRVQNAIVLLDQEIQEALPKILEQHKPPALRVVDERMLEDWEGQAPEAAPFELEELRGCAAPKALAEQAKVRFRPGLEFLRRVSIEDLIGRLGGIDPAQRLQALRAQGQAAWRLIEEAIPRQPARLELVGVPDASRSVFQRLNLGNRLVSTGDPYRVVFLRLVVGAPIAALNLSNVLRQNYTRANRKLVHVFPEVDGNGGQPSVA